MTHFRWTLRVVFLLGAILARASQASAAPVVFDATGDFNGVVGETVLSGTVTIDTATGKVVSADLKVEEGGTTLIFDQFRSVAVVGSGSLQSVAITVDGYNEKSRPCRASARSAPRVTRGLRWRNPQTLPSQRPSAHDILVCTQNRRHLWPPNKWPDLGQPKAPVGKVSHDIQGAVAGLKAAGQDYSQAHGEGNRSQIAAKVQQRSDRSARHVRSRRSIA